MPKVYKYTAFISYRHVKPDMEIAHAIHSAIEHFRVPKELDPEGKYREMRVFRDREELAAKDLTESLDEALKNSEYLIIVLSKRTPDSIWCTREVREFKKHHPDSHIIPVLVEGEPHESFNEELKNLTSTFINEKGVEERKELELLSADVRPEEVLSSSFPGYAELEAKNPGKLAQLTKQAIKMIRRTEIYRIMATILDVNFGDLKQRHKERRLRRLIMASVLGFILMIGVAASLATLYFRAEKARSIATQQSSMMLLKVADEHVKNGNRSFGLLVAREAMDPVESGMENYERLHADYYRILNDTLIRPGDSSVHVINTGLNLPFFADTDKGQLVIGGNHQNVEVRDVKTGALIKDISLNAEPIFITEPYDHLVYILTAQQDILSLDTNTWALEKEAHVPEILSQLSRSQNGKYFVGYSGLSKMLFFDHALKQIGEYSLKESGKTLKKTSFLQNEDQMLLFFNDGSIVRFSIPEEKVLEKIAPANPKTLALAMSSDFSTIVYNVDNALILHELDTGKERKYTSNFGIFRSPVFSPDGNLVYFIDRTGFTDIVFAMNSKTMKVEKSLEFPQDLDSIQLSEDGSRLFGVYKGRKEAGVIDLSKENAIATPVGTAFDAQIIRLFIAKDNSYTVANSQDGSIRIFKKEDTITSKTLEGNIMAVSGDNNRILITDIENRIKTYDFATETLNELGTLPAESNNVLLSYALSNDANFFAIGQNGISSANVYDKEGYKLYATKIQNAEKNLGILQDIQIADANQKLYTLDLSGEVYATDLKKGTLLQSFNDSSPHNAASHMVLSTTGRFLAVNYYTAGSALYDTETGEKLANPEGNIYAIRESDSAFTVIGETGSRFYEFDGENYKYYASNPERRKLNLQGTGNTDFVDQKGRYLVTTVSGRQTIVTDLTTGYRLRTLTGGNALWSSRGMISGKGDIFAFNDTDNSILLTPFFSVEDLEEKIPEFIGERQLSDFEKAEIGLLNRVGNDEK